MGRAFPDDATRRFAELLREHLRAPAGVYLDDVTGEPVAEFVPALTAPEQAIYDRLRRLAKARVTGITPAEWQALEPDIDGLKTYQNLASPTLAQTVQAVRAQSRILRALLRD